MQNGDDPNERWRMNDASGATRQVAVWHGSQMPQSGDCPEMLPAAMHTYMQKCEEILKSDGKTRRART